MTWLSFTLYGISIPVMFNIVQRRPFLFRISAKHSTLSPQKCTKLNTEKQHAQGHLGSNLTPGRENRNFRKTVITSSTKPLCRPRGNLSWQSHEGLCHCKTNKKNDWKKNQGWGQIWPWVAFWGLRQNLALDYTDKFQLILNKPMLREAIQDSQLNCFSLWQRGYHLKVSTVKVILLTCTVRSLPIAMKGKP